MRGARVATICSAVLLVLPAIALAQSAGDNQYYDPLAGNPAPSGSESPSNSSPSSGSQSQSQPQSQTQLAQTPSTGDSAQADDGNGDGSSLPHTGFPAGILAAVGALMLIVGASLRRRVAVRLSSWAGGSPAVLGRDIRLRRR